VSDGGWAVGTSREWLFRMVVRRPRSVQFVILALAVGRKE